MELAIAAVGKIFGALGIGGGAAATGTATAGAATAGTAGTLSAGQILSTTISALGQIGGALSAAASSRAEADQADLQAGQEQVESQQRQLKMKRSLLQVLGENDVTFASAGIDLGQGIAQQSADSAKQRALEEITIDRRDQEFRSALYRQRASGLRRRAGMQIGSGLLGAIGTFADTAIDIGRRGI